MNAIQITGSNPQADGTWKVGYSATYDDNLHTEGFVYVSQDDMNNMMMRDLPDYVSNKIVSELSKGSPSIDSVGTTDDSVTVKAE